MIQKGILVSVDGDMKFQSHVANICKKAYGLIGMIRRNFYSRDEKLIMLLYKAIVRPHLEYAW